jgi:ABC-type branched-subunit amino acid transport system ATPase component
MTDPILNVVGLNKHFGGIRVTRELNISISRGAKEAIIGPNGAGKSTLFNLLTGYHRPESGTIVFEGNDITRACAYGDSREYLRVCATYRHY